MADALDDEARIVEALRRRPSLDDDERHEIARWILGSTWLLERDQDALSRVRALADQWENQGIHPDSAARTQGEHYARQLRTALG